MIISSQEYFSNFSSSAQMTNLIVTSTTLITLKINPVSFLEIIADREKMREELIHVDPSPI